MKKDDRENRSAKSSSSLHVVFNELKIDSEFSWVMPNGSLSRGWLKTGDTSYHLISWSDNVGDDEISKVGDYDQGMYITAQYKLAPTN